MLTFFSFSVSSRFVFEKLDKKESRHQVKDRAQFSLLRDSFLDLIPALCFHIHGWEDGSLCQGILLFYVATLPYIIKTLNGMIGVSRCRYKTYLLLHFGQTTAKSAGASSEKNSIGISSDSFFASLLVANTMFFAVQFGFGQSKDGRRQRSVSAIWFFNFVLFPPRSMLMIRSLYDALDLQLIHNNVRI